MSVKVSGCCLPLWIALLQKKKKDEEIRCEVKCNCKTLFNQGKHISSVGLLT